MVFDNISKGDRILVVDDNSDNLLLIQTILEDDGYDVVVADDGERALEQLDQVQPDLILLDVMMPGIDGYEVTRQIRQHQKLASIPILLITAHRKTDILENSERDIDVNDFIHKPIDLDDLLMRVRVWLRS